MLNASLIPVARKVTRQVKEAETNAREALRSNLSLTLSMLDAQAIVAAPDVGHEALEHAVNASVHFAAAMRHTAASHTFLARTRTEMGLDAVSFGDVSDCPPATKPNGVLRVA